MDLKTIRTIIDAPIPNETKEHYIIQVLAKDENVSTTILKLLAEERAIKKDIITSLNLEVSRYHIHLNEPKLVEKEFLNMETKELYEKYKDYISPCFNNKFPPNYEQRDLSTKQKSGK